FGLLAAQRLDMASCAMVGKIFMLTMSHGSWNTALGLNTCCIPAILHNAFAQATWLKETTDRTSAMVSARECMVHRFSKNFVRMGICVHQTTSELRLVESDTVALADDCGGINARLNLWCPCSSQIPAVQHLFPAVNAWPDRKRTTPRPSKLACRIESLRKRCGHHDGLEGYILIVL